MLAVREGQCPSKYYKRAGREERAHMGTLELFGHAPWRTREWAASACHSYTSGGPRSGPKCALPVTKSQVVKQHSLKCEVCARLHLRI